MKIIDAHCDVLWKIWQKPHEHAFTNGEGLDSNYNRLKAGGVAVQLFAVFVPPQVKTVQKFQAALEMIDLFHEEILAKHPQVVHVRSWEQLDTLKEGQIGAMLTLEGSEPFGDDLVRLRTLFHLGVMSVGLTWNLANLLADGAGEKRGAGLTAFGREVVQLNNAHQVWTDLSHLGDRSFWDALELAAFPIASHSNARALCDHPRNLTDEQAMALFEQDGYLGVVFNPSFLKKEGGTGIGDILRHLDHFCNLGGVKQIGFGSDFDGITEYPEGLNHAGMYPRLIDQCLKYFKEEEVRGFAYQNFLNHRPSVVSRKRA